MNIIQFLYTLLLKFIPTNANRLEQLKVEAEEWYQKFIHGKPAEGETENEYVTLAKTHVNAWYTQTALAVLYLFAVKWVHDQMNSTGDDEEEEEED